MYSQAACCPEPLSWLFLNVYGKAIKPHNYEYDSKRWIMGNHYYTAGPKKAIIAQIMADFDKVYSRILHGVWTHMEI
jgi:hypothetical protein